MTDPKEALTHDMKRRSVLKAAAWTAPVVAAASIVPMAAASGETPAGVFIGNGRYGTSSDGRYVRINLQNADYQDIVYPSNVTTTLTVVVTGAGTLSGVSVTGGSPTPSSISEGTYTFTATPGVSSLQIRGSISGSLTFTATASFSSGFDTVTSGDTTITA